MSSTDTNSNNYLSGEADPNFLKNRFSFHKDTNNDTNNKKISKKNIRKGPLIEVIGEEELEESEKKTVITNVQKHDDILEDDLPPPLFDIHSSNISSNKNRSIMDDNVSKEEPSLMETMMAEAMKRQKDEKSKKIKKERVLSNKSTFASGFKKGFLTNSSSKKKKTKAFQKPELNKKEKKCSTNTTIPTIKAINKKMNAFELDEVQKAMNEESILNKIQSGFGTSPELMKEIVMNNPKLMAGMSNPKYMAALQSMQINPRETMKEMEKHADILDFLKEFMNAMGNYFMKLNENQTKDFGPIVEETLKKKREAKNNTINEIKTDTINEKRSTKSKEKKKVSMNEDKEVQKILQDKELVEILMDPDFQRIMKECSVPGKMRQYMNHPTHGPKLRKLMNAGLLQMA